MPGIDYHSNTMTLHPGDTLLIYTDGITEAFNPAQELFSEKRLIEAARGINSLSAGRGVDSIHDAVTRFAAGATQSDDLTLLLLRYKPEPEQE
jgi:sigma-B regulation protein RsbU (phosphoserine phosphatase)